MIGNHPWVAAVPALVLAALISSCSASLVNHPPIDKVKKVAVVSVSAKLGVRNTEGATTTGKMTAIAGMFSKKQTEEKPAEEKVAEFGGNKLVSVALESFSAELGNVKGWQVVAPAEFMNTPAYEKFKTNIKAAIDKYLAGGVSALAYVNTVQAPGTPFVGTVPETKQILTELAQDLNIDGVLVIYLDVAYTPSFAIGGTGTAVAAVGYRAQMVNRFGDTALSTGNYKNEQTNFRQKSSESTPMVAGNILYTPAVETMFVDSIRKDAVQMRTILNEQL